MKEIPEELNWVKARHDCSLLLEFVALKLDAENDVERKNELQPERAVPFICNAISDERFVVIRKPDNNNPFADKRGAFFHLKADRITVQRFNGAAVESEFDIRVGLDERGKCMMTVNSDKLYRWQVLQRALEWLFFSAQS